MKQKLIKNISTKKIKKLNMDKKIRFFLIIILIVLLTGNSINLYRVSNNGKYTYVKAPVYKCYNKAKINYEVNLIPNKIYQENKSGEGKVYISSLVDHIDTNLKYEFSGEKAATLKGRYNVIAVLEGYVTDDNGEKVLWKKQYEIKPETVFNGTKSSLIIENNFPIDLNYYKKFAYTTEDIIKTNFKSRISILWDISVDIKTDKGTTSQNLSPKMIIPLTNEYFEISGDLSQEKNGVIKKSIKELSNSYKNIIIWYVLEGILSIFLFLILILTNSQRDEDPLQKSINNIFNNYGDRLVILCEALKYYSKTEIHLWSIDDLVRVSDDLGKPILYEKNSFINDVLTFYVLDQDYVYILNVQ